MHEPKDILARQTSAQKNRTDHPVVPARRTAIILPGPVKCLKSSEMTRFRNAKVWQSAFVCLLISSLLIVVALAASPQLHQLFHHDADRSEHECAITVMVSGGSDDSLVPQVLEAGALLPVALDFLPERRSRDVGPLFLSAHIFEHAPPLV